MTRAKARRLRETNTRAWHAKQARKSPKELSKPADSLPRTKTRVERVYAGSDAHSVALPTIHALGGVGWEGQ